MTRIFGASADAETIQLEQEHGVYMLPVQINGQMTIPFVLDSGAAEVAIPSDVFRTLKRTGTVKDSDFVGAGTYILADGSKQSSQRFVLREVKVGDHVINDVIANVVPMEGNALLGQSFLSKLPAWSIDNARHAFVLSDGATELQATAAEVQQHCENSFNAKTYDDAMKWCRRAAEQGNSVVALFQALFGASRSAVAQFNIGLMYHNGWGVPQDDAEAVKWYRMAAEQGLADAQNSLGLMYRNGWGVPRDYVEAARWYEKAGDQNNDNVRRCQTAYTVMNAYRAYNDVLKWCSGAADQGDAVAQAILGYMYSHGLGVDKDCVVSKGWYERAAAAGNDNARGQLRSGDNGACRFFEPESTPSPMEESAGAALARGEELEAEGRYLDAAGAYKRAADQGNAEAQYYLGRSYFNGLGPTQSLLLTPLGRTR
jgi:hypothetical protein